MACDILIVGVNSASLQIPTFESAAQGLCQLFSNRSSRTNESVLFQLARPVTLLCGADATRSRVSEELVNLGKRCNETHDLSIVALFGGSKIDDDDSLCFECADGFIDLDNARVALRFVNRVCYILDCRYAAKFLDAVQQHQEFSDDWSQKVAAIASTRGHAFSVLTPNQGWHNLFATALLSCPLTDLEYDLDGYLETGDLIISLTLWFESTQARLANEQAKFRRHTILLQNPITDSNKTPAEHFFSQHVEWFVSPNFSLAESIIAHSRWKGSTFV